MSDITFKFRGYKSFTEEFGGVQNIRPINIVIGRNNCGKSAILEVLSSICGEKSSAQRINSENIELQFTCPPDNQKLSSVFRNGTSGGPIPMDHNAFAKKHLFGKNLSWSLRASQLENPTKVESLEGAGVPQWFRSSDVQKMVSQSFQQPFHEKVCHYVKAERYLKQEKETSDLSSLGIRGENYTAIIANQINDITTDRSLIENEMLNIINDIIEPDERFSRITVQRHASGEWEILFHAPTPVPLGMMGSGIQTIIIVAFISRILPKIADIPPSRYVVCLEEPENNLHPFLLRKIFYFIRECAAEMGTQYFITTHSNVLIDLSQNDPIVSITHVKRGECGAVTVPVSDYLQASNILDDLDVRASDLLQSNCVIWLEGPSDRIYLNRWIDIFSEGSLKEGIHYQCVFYGGKTLSHFSVEAPDDDLDGLLSVIRVNRNAIFVIDSDIKSARGEINNSKKRIKKEVEEIGGYCWVTRGKEVENYIPVRVFENFLGSEETLREINRLHPVWNTLNKIRPGASNYEKKKVAFASHISPLITRENSSDRLDLFDRISEVIEKICSWNKLLT